MTIQTEELFTLVWWRGTLLTRRAFLVVSLMNQDKQHELLEKFGFIDVEFEDDDD